MKTTRRDFNKTFSKGVAGAALAANIPFACAMNNNEDKKLGVALVGLGRYSTYQLAPALQNTTHCYLAGIVTGTPEKEKIWSSKYDIPTANIYNYDNFDTIIDNKDIDVVYVVLPNAMHADFCIRAAKAGKHVICEKPMAINVEECDAIIAACKKYKVKLGIGYRLHSEPYTQEVQRFVKEKTFGATKYINAEAAYNSTTDPDQWRLNKELSGGGALMNMGVYAIQSLIYGTGENPISVTAQEYSTRPEYFKNTDETITAQFQFKSGAVGTMMTSHNANVNRLHSLCENGSFSLDPANNYGPLTGMSTNGKIEFPHEQQQKLQLDDFAKHVLFNAKNLVPGEMGKRDMMIVAAIYKSIAEGNKKIPLSFSPNYGFSR